MIRFPILATRAWLGSRPVSQEPRRLSISRRIAWPPHRGGLRSTDFFARPCASLAGDTVAAKKSEVRLLDRQPPRARNGNYDNR